MLGCYNEDMPMRRVLPLLLLALASCASPLAVSSFGPATGSYGGYSYEVALDPAPTVSSTPLGIPSPGEDREPEIVDVNGQATAFIANELDLEGHDDARASALCAKYGFQVTRHLLDMYTLWVPTPSAMDLSDLPHLASAAGYQGHYRFHSWSGAALWLQFLQLKADADNAFHVDMNMPGYPTLDQRRYGFGADCLAGLGALPRVPVLGVVGQAREGNDLTLSVYPDAPAMDGPVKIGYRGCGALVNGRLELTLFRFEDIPSSISTCALRLDITFKDVPPGRYDVYDTTARRVVSTLGADGSLPASSPTPPCAM